MHQFSSPIRRLALVALAVAAGLLALGAVPAKADDAYRYWTYWWGTDGSWEYAATGPAERVVSQGDVEGWLFQTSTEAVPADQPGAAPDFAALCDGASPAGDGEVQVAVVIDYGSSSDTPDGESLPDGPTVECVAVPQGSTGADAVAAAAQVRAENGAVCGLNGYPASGCFEVVAAPSSADGTTSTSATPAADGADTTGEDGGSSSSTLWLTLLGVLVVGAAVAFLLVRNRNSSR